MYFIRDFAVRRHYGGELSADLVGSFPGGGGSL